MENEFNLEAALQKSHEIFMDMCNEDNPEFEAFKIRPTEIGWVKLRERFSDIARNPVKSTIERMFESYSDKYRGTFQLNMSRICAETLYPEFMIDGEYTKGVPMRCESSMEEYFRIKHRTYGHLRGWGAWLAQNDGD